MTLFSEGTEEIWYAPVSDRIVIFRHATFWKLPALVANDSGHEYIMSRETLVERIRDQDKKLIYIGKYET